MSDEIDAAQIREQEVTERALATARAMVAKIQKGEPGECSRCGEESPRLVGGVCAPCRDKYKLP